MNINKVSCAQLLTMCLFFASIINLHATQTVPASKQPEAPFTVTVVQTGAPSPEMLDRVCVKIMITNNNDRTFIVLPPYVSNLSFWNADNSKETINILIYGTGTSARNMALATGGVLLAGAACRWGIEKIINLSRKNFKEVNVHSDGEPTLERIAKCALYFGLTIGAISEIATLFRALRAKSGYAVTSHATITIQGYITQTALKKIQAGHLMPCPVAIALDNCENEALQLMYNAASTPKPTH